MLIFQLFLERTFGKICVDFFYRSSNTTMYEMKKNNDIMISFHYNSVTCKLSCPLKYNKTKTQSCQYVSTIRCNFIVNNEIYFPASVIPTQYHFNLVSIVDFSLSPPSFMYEMCNLCYIDVFFLCNYFYFSRLLARN